MSVLLLTIKISQWARENFWSYRKNHNCNLGSLKEALEQLIKESLFRDNIRLISISDTVSDELQKHKFWIMPWKGTTQLTIERNLSPVYRILFMGRAFKSSKFYAISVFATQKILQLLKAKFSANITTKQPKRSPIDHFTVVGLVTCPLNGSEAGVDLVWYRPHCFYCANQVVLMLTSWHLHEKSWEVCIKARPPPALLAFIGQVTKHTTVKWPISLCSLTWLDSYLGYIFPSNSGEGHKNMNVWVLTIIK